jgi:hypothetical protein
MADSTADDPARPLLRPPIGLGNPYYPDKPESEISLCYFANIYMNRLLTILSMIACAISCANGEIGVHLCHESGSRDAQFVASSLQ